MEFAYIKKQYQSQGIEWLRISPKSSAVDGVFILLYKDLSKRSLYDYWFEDLAKAKTWAKQSFDVQDNDWLTLDDLLKQGFNVIDEE